MNIQQVVIGTATRRLAGRDHEATSSLQLARVVGVAQHAVFYQFKNKQTFLSTNLEDFSTSYLGSSGHWC